MNFQSEFEFHSWYSIKKSSRQIKRFWCLIKTPMFVCAYCEAERSHVYLRWEGVICKSIWKGNDSRKTQSIAGFSDFRTRFARNVAEGAVLENFEDFLIILQNQCIQKALKLHFKVILDRPIFVSVRSKNLKFSPGRSKSTFQRPDPKFYAKKAHNRTNNA